MTNKEILIALPNDMLGGAEQFLKRICVYYSDKNYKVHVFFLIKETYKGWSDLARNDNITLHFGKGTREMKGAPSLILSLLKYRNTSFEFTFTSHAHLTGIIGSFRRLGFLKINHFVGRESTLIFKRFKGLQQVKFRIFYFIGYRSLDLLICQTALMKEELIKAIPIITSKINVQVLHNPIDIPQTSVDEDEKWNEILSEVRGPFIVSAGRLIPEKGYDILIEAFARIAKVNNEIRLLILGEGSQRKLLEQLIAKNGLKDRAFLPGRVNNVYPYFKKALLCIVSSRIEGFPNVLLQMMSQNANVASTLCAGGVELIPGLSFCNPNDPEELFKLLKKGILIKQEEQANIKTPFSDYLKEHSLENFILKIYSYLNIADKTKIN